MAVNITDQYQCLVNMQNYNIACGSLWVSDIEGGTFE
jgi:hypothetical protein